MCVFAVPSPSALYNWCTTQVYFLEFREVGELIESVTCRNKRGARSCPPRITTFDSPGLNQVQTYTVTMMRDGVSQELTNPDGGPFYAVPGNAGPRTMDYGALFDAATYDLGDGVNVFAGTVDDPFWIDLGAAFDTANFRTLASGVPGVLTAEEDASKERVQREPRKRHDFGLCRQRHRYRGADLDDTPFRRPRRAVS